MLDMMRRQHKNLKWVLWIIILALAGGMLIQFNPFTGSSFTLSTSSDVAKVGSEVVTATEFQTTYANYVKNMQQQLTPEIRKAFGFDKQILDYLVSQKVIHSEAKRLGLVVTDEEVIQAVTTNQNFQSGGAFIGKSAYEALLTNNGMKPEDFEQNMRNQLTIDKVMSFVTGGVSINDKDVEEEYRKRNEKAILNYFIIDPAKLEAKVTLSDADIKDFYEKNKARYTVPEKRKTRYALVDVIKYRVAAKADDAELKDFYDQHSEEYRLPETVTAQHILFKAEGKKPEEVEAIRKKATDVLARAKKGEDFAGLAKQFSEDTTGKNGGDLGTFQRGSKTPEFEQAAFALGVNAISDVVTSRDGLHIIKVNGKQEGRLRTFEEIKEAIRPRILFQKGGEEAKKVADLIANELVTNKDINAVATKHGATVKETALFEQAALIPEFGAQSQGYQQRIFTQAKDVFGTAIEVQNGFAVPQVTEIAATHPATLDEAKAKVTTDAKSDKARQMAADAAAKAQEQITAGKADLATLARAAGVETKTSEKVTRNGNIPDFGSIAERGSDIFSLPLGKVGPSTSLSGKTLVFAVKEREDINPDDMKKASDGLKNELLAAKRERYFTAYIKEVQKKMENDKRISVNETVMNQIADSVR
jgi:peptidyl-prolyl cis-trans isomerase D